MAKVAIIGSGMGGLTAGNLLAKKGHDVTIFESHFMPGGYTAGFWRKGFYFESGTLSFESSSTMFKAMEQIGIKDKVTFIRHKARWISDDYDECIESYADFKKMLYNAYPDEKENLNRCFKKIDAMYKPIHATGRIPSADVCTGFSEKLDATVKSLWHGLREIKAALPYINMTTSEFLQQFFEKGSGVYNALYKCGYPEMSAGILGGAMNTLFEDYWTVKEGMQAWADALADNFQNLGGTLLMKAPVDMILTKDRKAIGVASKGRLHTADYVVSASDYKRTFLELLDDKTLIPDEMLARIEQSPVSEGIFTVYLGLDMSNAELRKRMKMHSLVLCNEEKNTDVNNADDRRYFEKAGFMAHSPSMENQNLSPEGKSSLMLQLMTNSGWMNNWGNGNRQEYRNLKESAKRALIIKIAKVIPDLESRIVFEEAATPLTYERYTGNSNGASSAWSWNPRKKFFKSPVSTNIETPVKNLYMGSCWATQIGGVPGALAAGYACAKKIK
ncbi:MAG: NAD(P)/FAD-dependent oxidoreductase [Candidatus Nanoarchaeia archaeon]|nr:NAD(P)/FAD-dependent oxidoreductase [Candidatus Nanoarchaeia archaeon]